MEFFGKAEKAVNTTLESTAVEEVELVIAEANMQYYLDEASGTLKEYLANNFSEYTIGSGAKITFSEDGTIQYEGKNGEVILLAMEENGKVEITQKANGTKSQSYHAQHPELHIPTGFTHITGTVNDGYVISDNKENPSEGNQFVWIPVASSSTYQKK